jgi:PIN domain nuclease of toxin-antitoxin system
MAGPRLRGPTAVEGIAAGLGHVLLWWDGDLSKLSPAQNQAISDPHTEVFVSAVSAWELGIKQAAGRLVLAESVEALAIRFRFVELPITTEHGRHAAALPMLHKDPFDRMLVAQAIVRQMVLVTADAQLAAYRVSVL